MNSNVSLFKVSTMLSVLTGIAITIGNGITTRNAVFALGTGFLSALLLIPLWCIVVFIAICLYRLLLAPFVEVGGHVVRSARRQAEKREEPVNHLARQREEEEACNRRKQERRDQQRREDARRRCEMFFALHAPEIGNRFTRQMLMDYVHRYMGDSQPPERVEEYADQLEILLQQQLEKVQPQRKFAMLQDIAAWFEEQKQQIDSVPDERLRQTLLAKLKARYAELTTQFLEEMQT